MDDHLTKAMTAPEEDSGGIPPLLPRLIGPPDIEPTEWRHLGFIEPSLPPPDLLEIVVRTEATMSRMQEAFGRMAEMLEALPRFEVPRGGIQFGWDISPYRKEDPRKGEEVYVYDILPGARVYVLEDVFTVDRVDMHAPLPTVWLKELPTSPLYFTEDEAIYLANETEDQP